MLFLVEYMCSLAVPGCGSTFTRHFNLKGHLRSHNDERPYKCLYDGCPKATVGFARQHDCKRHMLLHEGLRPFECEGCGKKFARLDALTRHRKEFRTVRLGIELICQTSLNKDKNAPSAIRCLQTQMARQCPSRSIRHTGQRNTTCNRRRRRRMADRECRSQSSRSSLWLVRLAYAGTRAITAS
jgi:uncharacterized Zn-finger protein